MIMFILTISAIWSLVFFFFVLYTLFIFSILLYSLPVVKDLINFKIYKNVLKLTYLSGYDFYWFIFSFLAFTFIINFSWSSCSISIWFGHLIFANFQRKVFFLATFFLYLILLTYSSSFYWTSREVYDYWLTIFNFYIWTVFLFFANTFFTLIFFIETLSTLIFLLVINSTFSSTYFYNNVNFNTNNYFYSSLPFTYLQTLMFFFWVSLISSLNLFFFMILFYLKFITLDWYVAEIIFYYLSITNNFTETFSIFAIWLLFFFAVFIKCGLVPFYFWKPTFFKGLPFHVLFFYVTFFYFFIFLFFLIFFLTYVNEIFYFFIFLFNLFLFLGLIFLFFILCEAYYIKTFLALSSILNTLFVFLALSSVCPTITIFF